MTEFCSTTLGALSTLLDKASENASLGPVRIYRAEEHQPKGEQQDCDYGVVATEWVDQYGPGMSGDDFHGFLTWKLGEFYVVAEYYT